MSAEIASAIATLTPHLMAVALCAARLAPIAFLCPLLGGAAAPGVVRLGVVLSLAIGVHVAGGVAPESAVEGTWSFAALACRELALGACVGLVAALPFDAARIGGRLIDLVRGTSAEAALPVAGSRESATGDGLYQLVLALAVTGGAFPIVLGGIFRSFGAVKLGAFVPTEGAALQIVTLAGTALATGLAIGAPIAGATLAVDALVGIASRVAAPVNLAELGAPLRILGGGAVLWIGVGVLCERLLSEVARVGPALEALLGGVG